MRLLKKTLWAKIDSRGKLDFYKGELDAFLKLHPNRNVVIKFEIAPKAPSARMKAYYFNYVVPKVARAMYETGERMSLPQADRFLRENCPIVQEEYYDENFKPHIRIKTFDEMDSAEANEFIEWIKEYASQNLYTIIDDPEV